MKQLPAPAFVEVFFSSLLIICFKFFWKVKFVHNWLTLKYSVSKNHELSCKVFERIFQIESVYSYTRQKEIIMMERLKEQGE